jgi:hypothetical protein
MDAKENDRSPSERECVEKKPYSDPVLTDLGSIQQLSLGGVGPSHENVGSKNNSKKHS